MPGAGASSREAFNNLLFVRIRRGELAEARALLPAALERAPRNPAIFHNAACVAALGHVIAARDNGYDRLADLRTDDDLRDLWDLPEFTALFA